MQRTQGPASWTSLDIVGSNYHLAGHIARHAQFPDRVLVSTESKPPLGEADRVLDNTFVVGDFVWSAQDYLGEVGMGRWFYEGDPTEPMSHAQESTAHQALSSSPMARDELYPVARARIAATSICSATASPPPICATSSGTGAKNFTSPCANRRTTRKSLLSAGAGIRFGKTGPGRAGKAKRWASMSIPATRVCGFISTTSWWAKCRPRGKKATRRLSS